LKNYSEIISEYKEYTGKLSDDAALLVIQALFFENHHSEAFDEIALRINSAIQFENVPDSLIFDKGKIDDFITLDGKSSVNKIYHTL
jgi:hypothetical protein